MSYSIKYRKQAIVYLETHTYDQSKETFGVSKNALLTWKKKIERTGNLEDAPRKPKTSKIDPEALARYVEKHPDKYQHEIAVQFGCSQQGICCALQKLGITRKKRVYATKNKTHKK